MLKAVTSHLTCHTCACAREGLDYFSTQTNPKCVCVTCVCGGDREGAHLSSGQFCGSDAKQCGREEDRDGGGGSGGSGGVEGCGSGGVKQTTTKRDSPTDKSKNIEKGEDNQCKRTG